MPTPRCTRAASLALVACASLCAMAGNLTQSQAQTVAAIPGAIAAPEYDPNATKKFQPGRRPDARRAPAATTTPAQSRAAVGAQLLSPVPSGAGASGFDSSNSGKRRTAKKPKPKAVSPARELEPLGPVTPKGSIGRRPQDFATRAMASASAPGRQSYELGPIYTVPKRRKAHGGEDPYAPLGIRSGGLLFYPAVELVAGRNSNPSQAPGGTAANLYSVAPELRVQSDWLRHDFNADLRGNYTAFRPDTTPTLSRPYFSGTANGRIDVTHNDRINLGARTLVSTDNPGSPNLDAGLSRLPIYTTYGGHTGYAHRFNRLEIAVKGDAERTVYEDSKLTDGTIASNKTRNYDQYAGTVRVGYDYFPGVTPFVEATVDTRKHDVVPDTSGFNRNSRGFTGKAGTTFEMTRLLSGEVAIGYTRRKYDDAQLSDIKGLIGNASLIWNASALTTVKLTGTSTVGESTITDVSGVLYRDVGIQLDHAFRQWLIGTAKLGFGYDLYPGGASATTPDREDKRYTASLGLTYKLNRMMQLKGEVRRDWLRSNVSGVDYTANIFLLGLRLQY